MRAELALAQRKPDLALETLDRLGSSSAEYVMPRRELLRSEALAGFGKFDDAEPALLDARRDAELISMRSLAWRANAALGRLYARQRRPADAEHAINMARQTIRELTNEAPAGNVSGRLTFQPGETLQQMRGTVTFIPGVVEKTIAVPIYGDATAEPDETLSLSLSNPVNGVLATTRVSSAVRNDD